MVNKEIKELLYKLAPSGFIVSLDLETTGVDSSKDKIIGKNVGDDFKQGKITLPLILAYLRSNNEEKKFWKKTIENLHQEKDDLTRAIHIIKKYN